MSNFAPKIKLSNGQEIPVLGIGTWRSYESDAEQALKDAIDIGYRLIDTAFVYQNEHEVGSAIRSKIQEGVIKREDIFVVSKLRGIHTDLKFIENACRKSLDNLGMEYIDLYLMHFPEKRANAILEDVDYLDTWHLMEKLVDQGLVRGIGLSNFKAEQMARVLKNCRIKPLVNQIECHPEFNQKSLIEFSREHGIIIMAYCPLSRNFANCYWPSFIFDKKATNLAQRYGKTTAQISLRYLIQLGTIPIPKSVSKERIAQFFDIFDFELSWRDMAVMDTFNTDYKMGYRCFMAPPI